MNQAKKLTLLLEGARAGGFSLWKLNFALGFAIPFNKKHGFKVKEVGEDFIQTLAPYQRRNFNHLRGIHACGIATIAEFSSGLALLRFVDASKYRLIMSEIKVEYHYQAKKALISTTELSAKTVNEDILPKLEGGTPYVHTLVSVVKDVDGKLVATAHITWQLKAWDKVKTAL